MGLLADIFLSLPEDGYRHRPDDVPAPCLSAGGWIDNTPHFSKRIGDAIGADMELSAPRRLGQDTVTYRFGMDIDDEVKTPYEERSVIKRGLPWNP